MGDVTPVVFGLLCVAGGLGAVARFVIDGLVRERTSGALPWGTIAINVSGSFLLGLLTGLVAARALPAEWQLVAGTGFLGGYTTFSTASLETVRLLQEHRWAAGLVTGLGVVVCATAAAGLGWWIGALV